MALIFLSQSTCAICGHFLMPGEHVKGLPAISNTIHPLFYCGFHLQCFQNWEKKEEALNLIKEEKQKFKNSEYYIEMVTKYGIPKWLEDDE
ncbi:hypothetical protein [Longitalea arenae]|uniref:hypothetical protein n=1 Tax=Longitalea arenae TaxID=2812558 RepID=UPI0019678F36|nr:hypothetical protein [Longitalea arenae]